MMLYGPLLVWLLISALGPFDTVQGPSSKLLYVHVPTVWIAYLAYTLTFIVRVNSYYFEFNMHPSHEDQLLRLKKVEGQVRGIQNMIQEQ